MSARRDRAEASVRLAAGACREVERGRRACGGAVAERDRPEAVDRDQRSVASPQLALVRPLAAAAVLAADFVVSQGVKSGAARFLFATEGGQLLGWSPAVNPATALVGADSSATGALYKGLTAANGRLYATDF